MDRKLFTMDEEERKEYFNNLLLKEVEEVKQLIDEGRSRREILLMNEYSKEVLEKAGIGISDVIPRKEPQAVYEDLEYSIPNEGKFEYSNGVVFIDKYERDSLLMYLLANAGLERVVDLLPEESKDILRELLK